MNKLVTVVALGLALGLGNAYAASHAGGAKMEEKKPTAQQNKMVDCNKDAKEKNLKGDERKSFMSTCLKAKSDAQKAQQEKMKTCNKDAGEKKLKGDERKKFMSTCLSA